MQTDGSRLGDLLRLTARDPRAGARAVLALDPPYEARWLALALVVILSVLLAQIVLLLLPAGAGETFLGGAFDRPAVAAFAQAGLLTVLAGGMARIGQVFGGQGKFTDALLLVVWLEFILICLQVVQIVLMLVFPLAATLLGVLTIVLFFWLLTHFTAVLHGFSNTPGVFFGIIGSFFVASLLLVLLFAMLGVDLGVEGGRDV